MTLLGLCQNFSLAQAQAIYSSTQFAQGLTLSASQNRAENAPVVQSNSAMLDFLFQAAFEFRQPDKTDDFNIGMNSSFGIQEKLNRNVSIQSQFIRALYFKNTEVDLSALVNWTHNQNSALVNSLFLLRPETDTRERAVTASGGLSATHSASQNWTLRGVFNAVTTRDSQGILREWNGLFGTDSALTENSDLTFQIQGARTQRDKFWTDSLSPRGILRNAYSEKVSSTFGLGVNTFLFSTGKMERVVVASLQVDSREKELNVGFSLAQESSPRRIYGPQYFAQVATLSAELELNPDQFLTGRVLFRNEIGSPEVTDKTEFAKGFGAEIASIWNLSNLRQMRENAARGAAQAMRKISKHNPNFYGCNIKLSGEYSYSKTQNNQVSQQEILRAQLNYSF